MTVALEVLNVKIFDGEFEWTQVSLRAYCVFLLSDVFVFVFCRPVRSAKRNRRSTVATWRRRGSGRWRAGTRCVRVSLYVHVCVCLSVGMRVLVFGYACVSVWVCVCLSVGMHVFECGYACVWVWVCLCLSVGMRVFECGYACVWVWVCMWLSMRLSVYLSYFNVFIIIISEILHAGQRDIHLCQVVEWREYTCTETM